MGKMQNPFNIKADGTYSYHYLTVIKIYSNSIYTFLYNRDKRQNVS
jgi:hypothetical protein